MQVDLDIVVYAVIAALILGRLWSVLGSRNEDDPQRPNPFPPPAPQQGDNAVTPISQAMSRMLSMAPPAASLAGGLAQVMAADPAFDEKQFLQNARDVFTSVVGAYAAGNLNAIAEFLSPALLAHFQRSVDARKAAGQSAQSRVARIKDTEVTAARVEGAQAAVTVKIVSEQENVVRDAQGAVVGGAEGRLEEVADVWVFGRDTKTPGSKWVVVETRG